MLDGHYREMMFNERPQQPTGHKAGGPQKAGKQVKANFQTKFLRPLDQQKTDAICDDLKTYHDAVGDVYREMSDFG